MTNDTHTEPKLSARVADLLDRFVVKDEETGCWNWTGTKHSAGYGYPTDPAGTGKPILAHRMTYREFVGPLTGNLVIDHLCENRACCNPEHLEQVMHVVNTLRGTSQAAINAVKTHCKRGHEFTPENTRLKPQSMGRPGMCRFCKECERMSWREYAPKRKKAS